MLSNNTNTLTKLMEILSTNKSQVLLILVSTKTINFLRINLSIVKLLVDDMNMNGIYICVERPYKYYRAVFEKKLENISNIRFVDSISKVAGDVMSSDNHEVAFVSSPFSNHFFPELMGLKEEGTQFSLTQDGDLFGYRFIIIDNTSMLYCYQSKESAHKFIKNFISLVKRFSDVRVFFLLDKDADPEAYQMLSGLVDKEVDLTV